MIKLNTKIDFYNEGQTELIAKVWAKTEFASISIQKNKDGLSPNVETRAFTIRMDNGYEPKGHHRIKWNDSFYNVDMITQLKDQRYYLIIGTLIGL